MALIIDGKYAKCDNHSGASVTFDIEEHPGCPLCMCGRAPSERKAKLVFAGMKVIENPMLPEGAWYVNPLWLKKQTGAPASAESGDKEKEV